MTTHNLITLPTANTAVRITPPGQHSGMDITLQNVSDAAIIYIGGEDVTPTNYGFRIFVESAFSVELPGKDALYAVSDEPDALLAVLQFGLEG